jgi:hypothetical protein
MVPAARSEPQLEMVMTASTARRWLAAPLMLALAACDDGTGPDRLIPEDVAGIYAVCTLSFVPENAALPTVDVRTAAFELSQDRQQPFLALDPNSARTFELQYVPRGQFSDREVRGTYALRPEQVELRFNTTGVNPSDLLLPERVTLDFQPSPLQVSAGESPFYSVPRSTYAQLAGIGESGLAEQIRGRLAARFQAPRCT